VDFMGCRNVQVHGCNFTGCSDDTIGVKSDYALGRKIQTGNVYVWDNYFESGCNGLQFGSETAGDFRNINFWNIRIAQAMKAGIGITCNDGAIIDGVNYRDITISKAANRLRTGEPGARVGSIRNVKISNVVATDVVAGPHHGPANASTLSGRPDAKLENIVLENVKITYQGGGKAEEAGIVPPYPKSQYSPNGMGLRPASGFYIRHVNGLTFKNVEIAFASEEHKPSLIAFDVDGFKLENFKTQRPVGIETVRWEKIRNLTVHNSPGLKERKADTVEKAAE
jgi:polygalacturonase